MSSLSRRGRRNIIIETFESGTEFEFVMDRGENCHHHQPDEHIYQTINIDQEEFDLALPPPLPPRHSLAKMVVRERKRKDNLLAKIKQNRLNQRNICANNLYNLDLWEDRPFPDQY